MPQKQVLFLGGGAQTAAQVCLSEGCTWLGMWNPWQHTDRLEQNPGSALREL